MKKIYELAGELEIKEDLESDNLAEMSLPTRTKRRQEQSRVKRSLALKEIFKRDNLIPQN